MAKFLREEEHAEFRCEVCHVAWDMYLHAGSGVPHPLGLGQPVRHCPFCGEPSELAGLHQVEDLKEVEDQAVKPAGYVNQEGREFGLK